MSWREKKPFLCASRSIVSILMLLILFSPRCLAFKAGYYGLDNDSSSRLMLAKLLESADREIELENTDRIDIGVRKVGKTGYIDTTYFTSEQLQHFFSEEKHKNLLAVRFRLGKFWQDDLNKVKTFSLGLGYKRVIIFKDRVMGFQVFYDSDSASNKPQKRPRR